MIKLNTQNRLDYDVLANFMDNYIWYKFSTHVSNNFSIRAWYKIHENVWQNVRCNCKDNFRDNIAYDLLKNT